MAVKINNLKIFKESKDRIVKIPSFTTEGKFYEVNLTKRTCTCPAFKKGMFCKHLQYALGIKTGMEIGGRKIFSISLLKSALQKAVRRNEKEKAVRCAKSLIELDEYQILRRLPVIILEDGLLHPNFAKIIEILKRESKKFGKRMTEEEKDMIIQTVAEVAECEWRDNWVDEDEGVIENQEELEAEEFLLAGNWEKINELPKEEKELVLAIKYRASIGGMKGDVVMLNHYANLWAKRFIKREWTIEKLKSYFKPSNLKFEEVKGAEIEDIPLTAVDMHCSPLLDILLKKENVVKILIENFPEAKNNLKEKLNDLLWRQMSSVNFKKEIGSGKQRDWYEKGRGRFVDRQKEERVFNFIKDEIGKIQKWFLQRQIR
jgi:hypothetical protein